MLPSSKSVTFVVLLKFSMTSTGHCCRHFMTVVSWAVSWHSGRKWLLNISRALDCQSQPSPIGVLRTIQNTQGQWSSKNIFAKLPKVGLIFSVNYRKNFYNFLSINFRQNPESLNPTFAKNPKAGFNFRVFAESWVDIFRILAKVDIFRKTPKT